MKIEFVDYDHEYEALMNERWTLYETYTDDELLRLLKKPNLKQCGFTEYKMWVITNFLLSTGVRQKSLLSIKIKDLDFDSDVVRIHHTKNRKALIIPLNTDIKKILQEYLRKLKFQLNL